MASLRRLALLVLSPLAALIFAAPAAVLMLAGILARIVRSHGENPVSETGAPAKGPASIVILNCNGRDLLEEGLPSVVGAVRRDGLPHEILVVDNGSTDGSCEYLRRAFPQVRILALPENTGFAAGNNAGVRAARNEIVVLLNNDMIVEADFLRPLLEGFGSRTFAVTSRIRLQDPAAGHEETGRTQAVFRRGMIDFGHLQIEAEPARSLYPVSWAGGGSSAFHRERFLRLGGFDPIYSPAYVEDVDLSYRAWKAGWEVLFAPASAVRHKHRATSRRRFTPGQLDRLILRNQILFLWKNVRTPRLLISHIAFLPWNCYRLARDHGAGAWSSFLRAGAKLPALVFERFRTPREVSRTDEEVFRLFAKPALFFSGRGCRGNGIPACAGAPAGISRDRKPRILWLTAYLPHRGRHGGAMRQYHLLEGMAKHYRITLLTFLEEEEKELAAEVRPLVERVVALRRRPPMRFRPFAYEPYDEYLTPEMERSFHDCLQEWDFDLIQLEYTQMAGYALPELGIPTLLTKHEVDFAACARRARVESNPLGKLLWFYRHLQVLDREIALLRRVDATVCVTEPDRLRLLEFCGSVPVHVVNNGVDPDYFRPPAKAASEPRLVFVGAFRHEPNVDAMLHFCRRIFPRIRAEEPCCEMIIVGSEPPPAVLGLDSDERITVTGEVPDVRPYMAQSSIYVVPLRLGVGIRGKVLEAWSMGMPVVATPVACEGLRYENGRNLLVARTDEEFASRVVDLLRNPARRLQLGLEARRTVEEHYGWDAMVRRLDGIYRDLIARQKA